MKLLSLIAFAVFFYSFAAFAETAPALDASILSLIDAAKVGKLGVILVAVVQLLKTDLAGGFLKKINQKLIPWIMVGIAVIGNVGAALVAGKPWLNAVIEGVLISLTANGAYETIKSI